MLLTSPSQAKEVKKADFKYDFLMKIPKKRLECKKKSQKSWDSGMTSEMREGSYEYGECLNKLIIKLAQQFYPKNAFGDSGIRGLIDDLQKARLTLYWGLYNNCEACDGTMWYVMASGAAFDELENLLHEMSIRILESEMQDELIDKFESDWKKD